MTLFNHSSLVRHEPTPEQIARAVEKNKTPKGTPLNDQPVPRVTVAGIVKDNTLRLGISRCSIKDNFSKKHGRFVAQERAEKRPSRIVEIPDKATKMLGRFFYEQAQELIRIAQAEVKIPRFLSGEVTRKPMADDKLVVKTDTVNTEKVNQ